jgi:hypothetical protein
MYGRPEESPGAPQRWSEDWSQVPRGMDRIARCSMDQKRGPDPNPTKTVRAQNSFYVRVKTKSYLGRVYNPSKFITFNE